MFEKIQKALAQNEIAHWRIREIREESAELFFVKKELEMRRMKDVCKYEVTLFRDGERAGALTRASATVVLPASIDEEDVLRQLKDAFYAAQFAANPIYDLPDPVVADPVYKKGELAEAPLMDSAWKMAGALFAADNRSDAFVNSFEIFVTRVSRHILSSYGTDVIYTDGNINGEFVAQCLSPADVEMHHTFSYGEVDTVSLSAKVSEALDFVCDRAVAENVLKSGEYDLILSGNEVSTVLSYYTARSSASMLYTGYSGWKLGDSVQGDDCIGEKLNIILCATVPYDGEGIPMKNLHLLEDGVLAAIHGSNRFCRYLGKKPTGNYEKVRCENGTIAFSDMKANPCLWVVSFSDFQMDDFSGHFGGEIRLAYLIRDGKAIPVTGGSVNGSLLDAHKNLQFSTERYSTARYDGPYAVLLHNISVAGI